MGECNKCSFALTSFFLLKAKNSFKKISITNNPEDCSWFIITGCLLKIHKDKLIEIWQSIKKRHIIISFGDCGTEKQKIFEVEGKKNLAIESNDLSEVIPIDYEIEKYPPNKNEVEIKFQEILEQKS